MSAPSTASWLVTCPVCGTAVSLDPAPGAPPPCTRCGLPAAGQAGLVMARITATLAEIAQDREALRATLRTLTSAPTAPSSVTRPTPAPAPTRPPASPPAPVPGPPRTARRLSPQQVLLGLGAALVVAAALAFVAVGWQRFGLAFQVGTMLVATTGAIGTSAIAARRGLRATEEALAAAAAALVAIDLGALHARGLLGVDAVPLRTWTAVSAVLLAVLALAAGRVTRSTLAWPLVAVLVLQPVPLLLLPADLVAGPAGVGLLLLTALADSAVARHARHAVSATARVLAVLAGGWGVAGGLHLAWTGSSTDSWTATALLTAAAVAAVALRGTVPGPLMAGIAAAGPALALGGSLAGSAALGAPLAGLLGWAALLAAVLGWDRTTTRAACASAGTALAATASLVLLAQERTAALTLVALAAVVPAAAAALRVPVLRTGGTALALAAPVLAVLLAREGGLVSPLVAGMLVTSLAVIALAVAGARTARPEELAALVAGAAATLAASTTAAAVGAWSQLGVQLGVVGAAGLGYAVVSRRAPAAAVAVADLVVAVWTVLGGAQVELVEAYTLPLAAALTLLAVPALRRGPSWTDWGPALLVALVPSVLMVLGGGSVVRLVLVVLAATTAVVVGATTHRQAPFLVGAASLGVVVLAELAPLAPLLPRWLSLGSAGLVLLVVGATYERRRQQAREAVAWVGQMA